MTRNEKLVDVLNDLVEINHDRTNGYQKAADETKSTDTDLKALFLANADQSRDYASALTQEVLRLNGEPATDTTNLGKIYRIWMDMKATFTGKDRHAILASCEFGEDAAQKAYRDALASDAEMNAATRQLITSQQAALKDAHDKVKKYRDMQQAVNS